MSRRKLDRATQVVLTVVTANVGRGVAPQVAAAAIRRVVAAYLRWLRVLVRANVSIGFQEIDEDDTPEEARILHRVVRQLARGATLAGFSTAVPILCPKGWRVVEVWVDKISDGVPHWSPNRYLVGVLLEHERTGIRIVRLNFHLARQRHDLHAWEDGNAGVRHLVATRYLPMGYPIAATCDRNAAGGRLSPEAAATEVDHGQGIDQIRVIYPVQTRLEERARGRCASVDVGRRRTVRIGVDKHNAHGVEITLTAPQEAA